MAKKKPRRKKPKSKADRPVYMTQYEIVFEPMPERAFSRLPNSVQEQLERLHDEAQEKPQEAIPELLELLKKYPRVPQIYNYLAAAYSGAGEKEKAEAIVHENIRKNPNYLFAKINLAQLYLAKKEHEKIPEIFEHKFDLQMLYPKRTKFHISEVANFMGTVGVYFARTNQRDIAEKYNEILLEIAPDFPIAEMLNRELNPWITTRVLKRFLGE
jgi:tetratricopeptide (TPR) repeat protein